MKKILVSLALGVAMLCGVVGLVAPTVVYAADDVCGDTKIDKELRKAAGCKVDGDGVFGDDKQTIVPVVLNIMNVVLTFVGLIAVGVIVYGGITFVTSTADAGKVTKAKRTILYGVVGLVVALMSFAIVAFINTAVLKK